MEAICTYYAINAVKAYVTEWKPGKSKESHSKKFVDFSFSGQSVAKMEKNFENEKIFYENFPIDMQVAPKGADRLPHSNETRCRFLVLTQYKSLSLDRHLEMAWKPLFHRELGSFLESIPPQHRVEEQWYRGTADAVFQNIYSINQSCPDDVLVLAGDHAYAMDYRKMLDFHRATDADVTIGAYRVPVEEASLQLGVLQIDRLGRVIGFEEKPKSPKSIPDAPAHSLGSMGIYVFKKKFLIESLMVNEQDEKRGHDFGHDIIPSVFQRSRVFAFTLQSPVDGLEPYWKDVGTIEAYFESSLELLNEQSPFRLNDPAWPIRSYKPNLVPAIVLADKKIQQNGYIRNAMLCAGSVVSDAQISKCIIGYDSRVASGCQLSDSILLGNVRIGKNSVLNRVIVDKHSRIGDGVRIGFDQEIDRARGFTISKNGITVIPKNTIVETSEKPKIRVLASGSVRPAIFSGNGSSRVRLD